MGNPLPQSGSQSNRSPRRLLHEQKCSRARVRRARSEAVNGVGPEKSDRAMKLGPPLHLRGRPLRCGCWCENLRLQNSQRASRFDPKKRNHHLSRSLDELPEQRLALVRVRVIRPLWAFLAKMLRWLHSLQLELCSVEEIL